MEYKLKREKNSHISPPNATKNIKDEKIHNIFRKHSTSHVVNIIVISNLNFASQKVELKKPVTNDSHICKNSHITSVILFLTSTHGSVGSTYITSLYFLSNVFGNIYSFIYHKLRWVQFEEQSRYINNRWWRVFTNSFLQC